MVARLTRDQGRVGGFAAHATPLPRGARTARLSGPRHSARGARLVLLTLLVAGCTAPATPDPASNAFEVRGRGAQVSFVEYEAETAVYKGRLIGPDRKAKTLAGEASGRMAVTLGVGDRVSITLKQDANAITVRYSVPDGTTSDLRVAGLSLPLSARYSWFYGGYPFSNDPKDGSPHHFYDSVRTLLPRTYRAGEKVTLECVCTVDLADFELVAAPLLPRGVSIVDFGADPSGVNDSGDAIEKALRASREVWIPPGTFKVTRHIIVDHASIRGAGMWYSTLTGDGVGVYGAGADIHLSDFAIIGEVTERVDAAPLNGVGGAMGGGSTVERLFIQHTKVGMWFDGPFDGLTVRDCRIVDQTADGINLHRGISHALIENNIIRNTGDDGLALWSDQDPDHDNVLRHNTVQLPMLANGIGVYGGQDNLVEGNVIADTLTEGAGIQVANRFSGTVALSGTTTLRTNTVLRGGSHFPGVGEIGAIFLYGKDSPITGVVELDSDELIDSSFSGLHLFAARIADVRIKGLLVQRPGTVGLRIQTAGAATVTASRIEGGVYLCVDALPFQLTVTDSQGLDAPTCGGA